MDDLGKLFADWPVDRAAAGATDATGTRALGGDPAWRTPVASLTKLMVGLTALVAVEEGAVELDEPAGPPGATVRHLLAHASGLPFHQSGDDDQVLAEPGTRRIYSNAGIERFAAHLATRTGIAFGDYLHQAVLAPLGMDDTSLEGSPAQGAVSTVDDLLRFIRELLAPSLISPETLADATRAHFPELGGVLPSMGRFEPNPWGLAFELRGRKEPHWTGRQNSERTFGHFGGSGAFLWVDPVAGIGCTALTDREFGAWALAAWPPFSDTVLARTAGASG